MPDRRNSSEGSFDNPSSMRQEKQGLANGHSPGGGVGLAGKGLLQVLWTLKGDSRSDDAITPAKCNLSSYFGRVSRTLPRTMHPRAALFAAGFHSQPSYAQVCPWFVPLSAGVEQQHNFSVNWFFVHANSEQLWHFKIQVEL